MTKTMRKGRHNDKGKGKGNVKKRRVENGKKGEGETKGRMKTEEKKAKEKLFIQANEVEN